MISGARFRWLAVLAALAIAPGAQAQPAWGLTQLMQALAQNRGASASFTEWQTAPVLSAPLLSTGTLTYAAPDYLRKETRSPVPETFILNHGEVTLAGGGAPHQFALTRDPRIAGLVEGIRATLAGDLPALDAYYNVSLSGGPANWQLRLTPKDPSLAQFLRSMTIGGAAGQISVIDTLGSDGGETRMSIQAAHAP